MQRGFVMVMLLAIVAVLSVVLSVLLISNKQSAVIAIRESEEMKARSIAELCLSKGISVAVEHFRQRGGNAFDFDGLLDPDGIPGSGDDHVFANVTVGNTRLYVPTDAEGTPNQALYRYSFERFDPDGVGPQHAGGCYLRFDDNADDNLPGYSAQTGNTGGVAEGAGVNVNIRDRDASVVVTAIGIYPALGSTLDIDAYGKAHARVTLKQYFSATSAPAIYGNGEIRVAGNSEFCGSGGIRGVDINVASSSCVCGDGFARSINGATTSSTIEECVPTRCPDAGNVAVNVPNGVPSKTPFDTEFTEQCLVYSETLGENPSTFRIEDPTGISRSPTTAPQTNNGSLRLHLRNDGAVFVWDGRNTTNPLNATINSTPCDGFVGPWPPVTSPADNDAKNLVCGAIPDDDGLGAHHCGTTAGNDLDFEFCRRDAVNIPADPTTDPPTAAVTIPAHVSVKRCDLLQQGGVDATQRPNEPNPAAKLAVCTALAPGSTCRPDPTGNPLAREFCSPPGSPLNCSTFNPNATQPLPATIWGDVNTDITAIEAATCFSNGFRRDGVTPCTVGTGPVVNASQLCWRMVAKLDGVIRTPHDANGAVEWEGAGGGLQIPSTTATSRVANIRTDTLLQPSNVSSTPTETVLLHHVMRATAPPSITANAPVLRYDATTGWRTSSGWNNGTARRLPSPTNVFVAAMPVTPVLTMPGDINVLGVTWNVEGNVAIGPGRATLGGAGVTSATVQNYAGGSLGCTVESTAFALAAPQGFNTPLFLVSGSIAANVTSLTTFGRIGAGQGLLVDAPADAACLVGGLSVGGTVAGCSTGACDDNSVCFNNRVAVVGSIMSDGDLSAPRGIFAQRSILAAPNNKISQLISRNDICINGASRIAGQIVSEKLGGIIDVGPDLLMLQSGEVGVGFATKKTTWTDSSW